MNNSGFFVFDEEDMKRMTEMSPKEATHRNVLQKSKPFNFDEDEKLTKENPMVIPKIKG